MRMKRASAAALGVSVILVVVSLVTSSAWAGTIKLPQPPELEIGDRDPFEIAAELRVPDDTAEKIVVVKTSPFDRMRFPVGRYSVTLLENHLDRVFARPSDERGALAELPTVVVELDIEHFEAKIPMPAYKPYTASVVYKARVLDQEGEVVFTQTTTASAQTSKGMLSGFKAKKLAGRAAADAMNDAMTQLLEGLLDSEELAALAAGAGDE